MRRSDPETGDGGLAAIIVVSILLLLVMSLLRS